MAIRNQYTYDTKENIPPKMTAHVKCVPGHHGRTSPQTADEGGSLHMSIPANIVNKTGNILSTSDYTQVFFVNSKL
jgi:hypothetical protein